MGDHAACGGRVVQRPHRVAGTAELERARALQRLGLEVQRAARDGVDAARTQHRRGVRMRRDARGGGEDVFKYRLQGGLHAHSVRWGEPFSRSEEHTSELQSLMRISYAVFCLKKKKLHNAYRKHNT